MGDYTIKAQFEARCPPEKVKRWLDSPQGIAGWWSDKVEGAAGSPGDEFGVTFPTSPVVFHLVVSEIDDRVVEWHVPDSPPWWKDTIPREMRTEPQTRLDRQAAAQIAVPVLMLVGQDSPDTMKRDPEDVAAVLPNARITVLEGQQHTADVLAPERFAELLIAFLGEEVIP